MERVIRSVRPGDEERICEIYNHYVMHSHATFEEEPIGPAEVASRITAVTGALPYLVCEEGGALTGYAYAAPWRQRSAYRYSVEVSAYVDVAAQRRGIGRALYEALFPDLERRGVHAVLAGIALPNTASERLHQSFGFVRVAHLREVGWKLDRWVDVAYWQLLFGRGR